MDIVEGQGVDPIISASSISKLKFGGTLQKDVSRWAAGNGDLREGLHGTQVCTEDGSGWGLLCCNEWSRRVFTSKDKVTKLNSLDTVTGRSPNERYNPKGRETNRDEID
jgi:hypothetical protein